MQREKKIDVQQIENSGFEKSSVLLTNGEHELLNMGLNYVSPPERMPTDTFIAEVETTLSYCETDEETCASRNDVESTIANYNFSDAHRLCGTGKFQYALESLRQRRRESNIIITRVDKGDEAVILDMGEYVQCVESMLQGKSFAASTKAETRFNARAKKARLIIESCATIMNGCEKAQVRQSNLQFPRSCALPEIHRTCDTKLRTTPSAIQSPICITAKWLRAKFKNVSTACGFFTDGYTRIYQSC